MDYGVLINAVEQHVCLYDKKNPNYKNLMIKEKAWDEIAEMSGIPKDECKRKWSYLREKFNKEAKKRDLPSGCETPIEDEWPYLENMMFLKAYIQPRKTKSNKFSAQPEVGDESETTGDDSNIELTTPKRPKPDPFEDTCLKFQEILDEFSDRNRGQIPETADDQFFKTLRLLYDELPCAVKDQARLDMLGYVTNLRTVHLKY